MKKVVKVNIGNLAFTLNEDAFEILNKYLEDLKKHYKNKPSGFEVVEGIEERIAELFAEKSGVESVVGADVVNEVIGILGRPEVIDEDGGKESYTQIPPYIHVPKRLYRNPDNRVLGGVCSGIAAYFNMDVVVVRLIYVLIAVMGAVIVLPFFHTSFFFMVLLYIILWIAVPEARTVEQRCAMYGEAPDISHIQKRVVYEANRAGKSIRRAGAETTHVASDIFNAIAVAIGIIFILAGFAGIAFFTVMFLGFEIVDGFVPIDIINYIDISNMNMLWIKICSMVVLFIPFIGLLTGGVQMVFRLKRSRFRPGLLLAILWWVAFIALIALISVSSRNYWEDYESDKSATLGKTYDTLYVKYVSESQMPPKKAIFDAGLSSSTLLWYDNSSKESKIVAFPHLKLVRQSDTDSSMIRTTVHTFGNTRSDAIYKAENTILKYELKDSLLLIYDDVYTKRNKWDGTFKEIKLYLPEKTKVLIQGPVYHDFEKEVHFRNHCHINIDVD